jgi:hypothetical protein
VKNLWKIVATEREIEKVMLIYDSKEGKKNWKVTYLRPSDKDPAIDQNKRDSDKSDQSMRPSVNSENQSFFGSLLGKLKLRFSTTDKVIIK